ncbi:MAG: hypothetical protein GWO08_00085 [Gammaproteobacteria bacterium]|nr:hypothetical protein [Gammaproteobacteria bacterium]NIN61747.1 hypothetical protein [Gammaproteobacteria bacterium]NIO62897.1 hypothetical protein [Gammaproteobacteria bacterium]NIQ08145.1 hypothetical protein [Gammaproteobacteria bacterium]NIQ19461.1 hypothetical protein [Gammaproteobacteria bacterium]
MPGNFELPIHLRLKRSKALQILVIISHGGALVCAWPINLPLVVKLLISFCVIFGFVRAWRCLFTKQVSNSPLEVILQPDDRWILVFAGGQRQKAILLPGSYVHPWLVIIALRSKDRTIRVIIPADGVDDPQALRRLRTRLIQPLTSSDT